MVFMGCALPGVELYRGGLLPGGKPSADVRAADRIVGGAAHQPDPRWEWCGRIRFRRFHARPATCRSLACGGGLALAPAYILPVPHRWFAHRAALAPAHEAPMRPPTGPPANFAAETTFLMRFGTKAIHAGV